MSTGEKTRAECIRHRLEVLRASLSPSKPVCFHCGESGHLAHSCRNTLLCFLCNRFGQKARLEVLTKAKLRVQSSYNLKSGKKGIPLVLNFPYARLTTTGITSLFRAYHIRLGVSDLHEEDIVRAIQQLDRQTFEMLINQVFDKLKATSYDSYLILDQDESGFF